MAKRRGARATVLSIGVKSAGTFSFIFIAKIFSLIVGLIMLVVVARILGATQYGVYTLSLAVAGIIGAFGQFSIGPYFNNIIPKLRSENRSERLGMLVGDMLVFIVPVCIFLMAIGLVIGPYISMYMFGSTDYFLDMSLAILGLIWVITYPIFYAILMGVGTGKQLGIATAFGITVQAIISITLVALGFQATGALVGYLIGVFAPAALTLYYVHRYVKVRFALKGIGSRIKGMLEFVIPITLSGISSSLVNNFSVVILGLLLVSTSLIGQYGIASKAGQVIDIVLGTVSLVLIPMFSTAIYGGHKRSKIGSLYHASLHYGLMFTIPMIVYASILSYQIIVTVFTSAYNAAAVYLPLVSVGTVIGMLGSNAAALLISFRKVRMQLRIALLVGAIQTVSILVLTPLFHVIGMIVAYFFIGNLAYAIIYTKELDRIGIRINAVPVARVIVANLILAAALAPLTLLTIRPLYVLIIGIAETLVIYPIILAKLKAVSKSDIVVLNHVSDEVPVFGSLFRSVVGYTERFM